ncbi:MAG: hypothetical protein IMY67_12160 [Bacteroidetes bacterium]|nr:hypothetical protein [Bacteroidota bacterium]
MTALDIARDDTGAPSYGIRFTDENYKIKITAATDVTLTVPVKSKFALFSAEGKIFYVSLQTIVVSTGSFVKVSDQANPGLRQVIGGSELHFFSPEEQELSVSFYE